MRPVRTQSLAGLGLLYVVIIAGDVVEVTHRPERICTAGQQNAGRRHRQHTNVVLTRFLKGRRQTDESVEINKQLRLGKSV